MLHTKSPPQVQVPTALLDPALPRLASLAVLTSFAAMSWYTPFPSTRARLPGRSPRADARRRLEPSCPSVGSGPGAACVKPAETKTLGTPRGCAWRENPVGWLWWTRGRIIRRKPSKSSLFPEAAPRFGRRSVGVRHRRGGRRARCGAPAAPGNAPAALSQGGKSGRYCPLHKIGVLHEETDSPRGGLGRGGGPPLPVGPAGRAPRLRRLCKRGSLPRERSVAAVGPPKFRDAE